MRGKLILFSLLVILLASFVPARAASVSQPVAAPQFTDGYALIDAVNQLRAANGLPAYQPNTALMISAQLHSEYQVSLGTWSHEGPGGTNEAQRAAVQGYGGSGTYFCDENVGYGHQFTAQQAVDLWMDPVHLGIMLSSRYVDAGGGVAVDGTGRVYFTLDVCVIPGGSTSTGSSNTVGATPATFYGVATSTPEADGAIYHEVQPGESLFSIAEAYNISFNELLTLNNYTQDAVIYPGEKLLIRVAPTPTDTSEPTFTPTPVIPTATRRPTRTPTPIPTAVVQVDTPVPSATPTPSLAEALSVPMVMGTGLPALIVSLMGVGLVLILAGSLLRLRR